MRRKMADKKAVESNASLPTYETMTTISTNPHVSLPSISENRREIAQKIIDGFAVAGYGTIQQVAALATAIAKSGLDPEATVQDMVGLFLFHPSVAPNEQLTDPDVSIRAALRMASSQAFFQRAQSLSEAVDAFARIDERPAYVDIGLYLRIAKQLISAK
jgi:hypothetical protein